jgi:hypothetical protein
LRILFDQNLAPRLVAQIALNVLNLAGILLLLQRAAKTDSVNFGIARRTSLGRPSRRPVFKSSWTLYGQTRVKLQACTRSIVLTPRQLPRGDRAEWVGKVIG